MTAIRTAGRVFLAMLVVVSTVGVTAGPVVGQTGAYTHTYTDAQVAVVDFGDHTGQVDIRFTSSEVDRDGKTVYATTISTNQIENNRVRFRNLGAYENLTVTVTGPSSAPTYSTEGVDPQPIGYVLGSTGGDTDFSCGPVEALSSAVGGDITDCTGYPGIASINTSAQDANQTKIDMYQRGAAMNSANSDFLATQGNAITDSYGPARSAGVAAYVDAVNNNATQAEAEAAAIEAVNDYYAVRQRNLVSRWNSNYYNIVSMRDTAESETGIASEYPATVNVTGTGFDWAYVGAWRHSGVTGPETYTNETLVNGNTTKAARLVVDYLHGTNSGNVDVHPSDISVSDHGPLPPVHVQAYNTSVESQTYLRATEFHAQWNSIEAANSQVESEMVTLSENTYNEIQSGELDASELLTPQVLASEYGPENYRPWAFSTLTAVEVNSPENLDQFGAMNVSTDSGEIYQGVLMSSENPTSGRFEVGTTYDPASLGGSQYIVTTNDTVELTDPFTIEKATDSTGESVQNVTYQDTTYEVSNTTQLQEVLNQTAEDRAEIEAYEQQLIANAGIPGMLGSESSISPKMAMMIIGAFVAVILIARIT